MLSMLNEFVDLFFYFGQCLIQYILMIELQSGWIWFLVWGVNDLLKTSWKYEKYG